MIILWCPVKKDMKSFISRNAKKSNCFKKDTSFFIYLNSCHVSLQTDNFPNQLAVAHTNLFTSREPIVKFHGTDTYL